jgi:flagellar P-ring protein precursor FlgI
MERFIRRSIPRPGLDPLRATLLGLLLACPASQVGATQVQAIARLKGAETNKLVGMGLVFGLKGTGDGGKFLPAMRPLAQVIGRFVDPNTVAAELSNSKNVALVALSAEAPASGMRDGDLLDVRLSAVGPAKSLDGGRLFMIPMTGPVPGSPVFAYAEGPVIVEDSATPTTALVRRGARVVRDLFSQSVDEQGRITLVLHEANATWPMATNLANHINELLAPDGPPLAKAIDAKNIVVTLPAFERDNPAVFISRVLQSYIDPDLVSVEPRVVINEKTGTIVITGDVQVSPVLISHKGLTIDTITPQRPPTPDNPRVESRGFLPFDPSQRGGANLSDLVTAFNQLKVEARDRIAILRELHRSGKLHAQLVLE